MTEYYIDLLSLLKHRDEQKINKLKIDETHKVKTANKNRLEILQNSVYGVKNSIDSLYLINEYCGGDNKKANFRIPEGWNSCRCDCFDDECHELECGCYEDCECHECDCYGDFMCTDCCLEILDDEHENLKRRFVK